MRWLPASVVDADYCKITDSHGINSKLFSVQTHACVWKWRFRSYFQANNLLTPSKSVFQWPNYHRGALTIMGAPSSCWCCLICRAGGDTTVCFMGTSVTRWKEILQHQAGGERGRDTCSSLSSVITTLDVCQAAREVDRRWQLRDWRATEGGPTVNQPPLPTSGRRGVGQAMHGALWFRTVTNHIYK